MDNDDNGDVNWRELCARASKEMDSEKLMELVRQIMDVLKDRERTNVTHSTHSSLAPCESSEENT